MVKKAFLFILFSLPPTVYGAAGGVSLTAEVAFMLGDLPVTNSMITSWVISLLIILVIRALSGKTSLIPNRGQLFVESIVGSITCHFRTNCWKKSFLRLLLASKRSVYLYFDQ
jgi:F0F1-type ATP synthase membrane subunit a